MTTSPASRRQSFTYDGRALEIRVVFSDENWTTWVYEDGHHLAAVRSLAAPERGHTACGAEQMMDDLLPELIVGLPIPT